MKLKHYYFPFVKVNALYTRSCYLILLFILSVSLSPFGEKLKTLHDNHIGFTGNNVFCYSCQLVLGKSTDDLDKFLAHVNSCPKKRRPSAEQLETSDGNFALMVSHSIFFVKDTLFECYICSCKIFSLHNVCQHAKGLAHLKNQELKGKLELYYNYLIIFVTFFSVSIQ